jgi:hypothetical protein
MEFTHRRVGFALVPAGVGAAPTPGSASDPSIGQCAAGGLRSKGSFLWPFESKRTLFQADGRNYGVTIQSKANAAFSEQF